MDTVANVPASISGSSKAPILVEVAVNPPLVLGDSPNLKVPGLAPGLDVPALLAVAHECLVVRVGPVPLGVYFAPKPDDGLVTAGGADNALRRAAVLVCPFGVFSIRGQSLACLASLCKLEP